MKFEDVTPGNPPLTAEEIAQMAYQVGDTVTVVNVRGCGSLACGVLAGPQVGDTGTITGLSTSRITLRPYLVRTEGADYENYFGAENLQLWDSREAFADRIYENFKRLVQEGRR